MKQDPSEYAVRERMQPGVLSLTGFLGSDTRNLGDIIAADLAEVEAAGVSPSALADLLDELHAAADAALGSPRSVFGGQVTVQLVEVRGRIPCPFGCGHRAHKAVIEVRSGDLEFRFTPLHAHLVRQHAFFQGRGAPFRLEPLDAVRLYRACRGSGQTG